MGGVERYYKDGIKKYEHYKDSYGYEWWSEYTERGNEIRFEQKSRHNLDKAEVVDIEPFTFENKINK